MQEKQIEPPKRQERQEKQERYVEKQNTELNRECALTHNLGDKDAKINEF